MSMNRLSQFTALNKLELLELAIPGDYPDIAVALSALGSMKIGFGTHVKLNIAAGTYNHTSQISIPQNIRSLELNGTAVVDLNWSGAPAGTNGIYCTYPRLRFLVNDVWFTGTNTGVGLVASWGSFLELNGCGFSSWTNGASLSMSCYGYINNCTIYNCYRGFNFTDNSRGEVRNSNWSQVTFAVATWRNTSIYAQGNVAGGGTHASYYLSPIHGNYGCYYHVV